MLQLHCRPSLAKPSRETPESCTPADRRSDPCGCTRVAPFALAPSSPLPPPFPPSSTPKPSWTMSSPSLPLVVVAAVLVAVAARRPHAGLDDPLADCASDTPSCHCQCSGYFTNQCIYTWLRDMSQYVVRDIEPDDFLAQPTPQRRQPRTLRKPLMMRIGCNGQHPKKPTMSLRDEPRTIHCYDTRARTWPVRATPQIVCQKWHFLLVCVCVFPTHWGGALASSSLRSRGQRAPC